MLKEVGACEDSQLYLAITHDSQGRVPNDTNKIDLKFNTYSEYMNALLG
jgi:predicted GIY-YIG superfamily endonuclease